MELAAAAALGATGYYLNNGNINRNRDNSINDKIYSGRKPNTRNIYDSNTISKTQSEIMHEYNRNWNKSSDPIRSNIIPIDFTQEIRNSQTTPIQFLQRPTHTRTTNQRDSENTETNDQDLFVNSLTGIPMRKEEFKHNNMVPFFGSNVRQNTGEYGNQHLLETFTGTSNFDKKKIEIEPLFDPQKNLGNVYGMPTMASTILDRYVPSQYRQNESPIDSVRVGPGLNRGFTTKPSGGFQQAETRDYVLPKTTNETRTLNNPKLTYKSRVAGPPNQIGKTGLQGKICKNLPDTYFVNSPDRYFTTTGAVTGRTERPTVIDKYTNRQNTTKPYTGSAGPAERMKPTQRSKYRMANRNIFTTSGARNFYQPQEWTVKKDIGDYGKNGMYAAPTERETTEDKTYTGNLVTVVKALIAPLQDMLKETRKENFVGSIRPTGNVQMSIPEKMTVYDPNDVAKTTIKETNIHNQRTGNVQNGPKKLITYDPNDIARTTIKETNIYDNRSGNIQHGPLKPTVYDPNDITRTTIKETNIHDNRSGNIQHGPLKPTVYDPNDITRTTIKETNIHDNRSGNIENGPLKPIVYDPNDITRTTIKETNIHDNRSGNIENGPLKPIVYDPNDITRTTIKETNIHDNRSGNIENGPLKPTVYDPNDITRTTIKETNIHDNRSGNIENGPLKPTVYDPNDITRTTIKETNIHDNRSGNIENGPLKPTVYDPNDITRTTIKETNIHDNRSGNIQNGPLKPIVYDPSDITRTTIKETNIHDNRSGNIEKGPLKPTVYDPNDIAKTTIKETNIHDNRTGNFGNKNLIKEGYTTNPQYAPNTNKQFTSNHEYTGTPDGDAMSGGGDGYLTTSYKADNTNKQFTSNNEYTGGAGSNETIKPMSYSDVYNQTMKEVTKEKDIVSKGRAPTLNNTKISVGEDQITINVNKLESDIINTRELAASKIYNSIPQPEACGVTTTKSIVDNETIEERINPEILEQFKKNPYTQPLDSFAFP